MLKKWMNATWKDGKCLDDPLNKQQFKIIKKTRSEFLKRLKCYTIKKLQGERYRQIVWVCSGRNVN
jgi:hypothetical protein